MSVYNLIAIAVAVQVSLVTSGQASDLANEDVRIVVAGGHGGDSGGGGAPPPEADAHAPKPEKKPKPKPNKDKNCSIHFQINIEIEGKPLEISQETVKNLMRGIEGEAHGFNLYADPDRMVLKIRDPEGNWFMARMTRIGDPDEGCTYFLLGEVQATDEPPLF